eukprot:TRINITY_DN19835_c0_g3_i1.p1 TRINITY_DN19835_c0_g3~~TRINITY_DN19835_c0_g3_i1.p1  ORF type:complete len:2234 (-),score=387.39 TRINITY_DN19835_c0_g3_i1:27-6728(-)
MPPPVDPGAAQLRGWDAGGGQEPVQAAAYVNSWTNGDVALACPDRRLVYSFQLLANSQLSVVAFDGLRPGAVVDAATTGVSPSAVRAPGGAGAPGRAGGARGRSPSPAAVQAAGSGVARPIAGCLLRSPLPPGEEGAGDSLLVLLADGSLLLVDAATLAVCVVLAATFPAVSTIPFSGSALTVLDDMGVVLVAEGSQGLSLLPVPDMAAFLDTTAAPAPAGGKVSKAVDLPKGCDVIMVKAHPTRDCVVLVGCTGDRLLLYSLSVSRKGQTSKYNFSLIQALSSQGGGPAAPTARTGVSRFFKRSVSPAPTAAGDVRLVVTDASVLDAGEGSGPGLLAVCVRDSERPSGMVALWQTTLDLWRENTGTSRKTTNTSSACRHIGVLPTRQPLLRVELLAPGRCGSLWPLVIALDSSGSIVIFILAGRLQAIGVASLAPAGAAFDPFAARTFGLTGSMYILVAAGATTKSQVGWLDLGALLESCGSPGLRPIVPLGGRARSCARPAFIESIQLPATGGESPGGLTLPVGQSGTTGAGEVLFTSQGVLRNYNVSSGRVSDLRIGAAAIGVKDFWVTAVLDQLVGEFGHTSHLLLSVAEPAALRAGGTVTDGALRSAWVVSISGEVLARLAGAFDGAIFGRSDSVCVAWLVAGTGGSPTIHAARLAAASSRGGVLPPATTVTSAGLDRILRCPANGGNSAVYWGAGFSRSPLRLSAGPISACNERIGPANAPPVFLPLRGPAHLVDAQWDNQEGSGRWHLVAAAPYAMWILRFRGTDVSLVAWLDLGTLFAGAGRCLSACWLLPVGAESSASGSREGFKTRVEAAVVFSTTWGAVAWRLHAGGEGTTSSTTVVALTERPQLVCGALVDRLLCVESQCGVNCFVGFDKGPTGQQQPEVPDFAGGGAADPSLTLQPIPRARLRTRPVNFVNALAFHAAADAGPAVNILSAMTAGSDWRLSPADLPDAMPAIGSVARQLWPAATCSEAPSQLCQSPAIFRRLAQTCDDEFRGLAGIVCGFQSGAPKARGRGDQMSAEEARATSQAEEALLRCRIDPGRLAFLHCAAELLVSCAKQAGGSGGSDTGLAIASRGLAKHDLLPFGMLAAVTLRPLAPKSDRRQGDSAAWVHSALHLLQGCSGGADGFAGRQHCLQAACSNAAPLVVAVLSAAAGGRQRRPQAGATDFSAAALAGQQFSETPVVNPPGRLACQLHTATLLQWLGLGTTEMRVRVFQAILRHETGGGGATPSGRPRGSSASPVSGSRTPGGTVPGGRPAAILSNGLLVYWRCADGENNSLRDSAGCGRRGVISGAVEWRGPLPPDDPIDNSDEWGSPLAPGFGVLLASPATEVSYAPSDGAAGVDDRQMLCLVGGDRSHGAEEHLQRAVASDEDAGDDDGDAKPQRGWTVELWARFSEETQDDCLLFCRTEGDTGSSPQTASSRRGRSGTAGLASLAWSYNRGASSMKVRMGTSAVLQDEVPVLAANEWVHLALRSDLSSVEVWINDRIAARSRSASQPLPSASTGAGLRFGPAAGMEMTEIRVWGVFRSDATLLEDQRRPLPTLLQDEKRADVWKKVKFRGGGAAPGGPAGGDGGLVPALSGPGDWGLTQLVAPAAITRRGDKGKRRQRDRGRDADLPPADHQQPPASFPTLPPQSDPFGLQSGPADAWPTAFDSHRLSPTHEPGGVPAWPSSDPARHDSSPTLHPSFTFDVDDKGHFPPVPAHDAADQSPPWHIPAPGLPAAPEPIPGPASPGRSGGLRSPGEVSLSSHESLGRGGRSPTQVSVVSRSSMQVPPAAAAAFAAATASMRSVPKPPSEDRDMDDKGRYGLDAEEAPAVPPSSKPLPVMLKRSPGSTIMIASARAGATFIEVFSHLGFAIGDVIEIGKELNTVKGFGSIILGSPLKADHYAGTVVRVSTDSSPSCSPSSAKALEITPDPGLGLMEVLPKPQSYEAAGLEATDTAMRAALKAMEQRSFALGATAFRVTMQRLIRQLGPHSERSAAVRSRLEAAASYGLLCNLLRECEELRESLMPLGASRPKLGDDFEPRVRRLAMCWACVLRLGKAPKDTVLYAVQAMATFFTAARQVGGGVAAYQVAAMLLERCSQMLAVDQLKQVSYVADAARHEHIARGGLQRLAQPGQRAPPGVCGNCPCCGHWLEALSPDCAYCGVALSACFVQVGSICDAERAARCNLCGAIVGEHAAQQLLAQACAAAGYSAAVPRPRCPTCNIGELRTRTAPGSTKMSF